MYVQGQAGASWKITDEINVRVSAMICESAAQLFHVFEDETLEARDKFRESAHQEHDRQLIYHES